VTRLFNSKKLREDRELKIEEERSRKEDRQNALQEAKEKWENDNKADLERYEEYVAAQAAGTLDPEEEVPIKPMYDEKYFLYNYDEEHPEITIPPSVTDDIDHDW